jgi:multiple sugar transport system permease protein
LRLTRAQPAAEAIAVVRPREAGRLRRFLRSESVFGYALMAPVLLYLGILLLYPLLLSMWFAFSNAAVEDPFSSWAGLQNFRDVWADETFRLALRNSFIFTFGSEVGKIVLGNALAFLLLRKFLGRRFFRTLLVLPWTMPVALTTLGWLWMFDPHFSVVNWTFREFGLGYHPNWLGEPVPAMLAIIITNVWRGFPFAAIILLAGMTSIPSEIIESAELDGAGFLRRFHSIIVPMILPILFIGLIFDLVFSFTDLSVVYLLTKGGPENTTHILPTLTYQNGITGGNLAQGAAISMFMIPVFFVAVVFMLRLLRRREI